MKYIIELTEKEALAYGLILCECGHPKNNHFMEEGLKPCAHCKCTKYRPVPRAGRFITTIALANESVHAATQNLLKLCVRQGVVANVKLTYPNPRKVELHANTSKKAIQRRRLAG